MNRRPQFRWSMPALAAGPVYGPVSAISAFAQDGFNADAEAGEARPPTVAAITATAVASTSTATVSPVLFLIQSSSCGLPSVTPLEAHCFSSYAIAGLPDG